MYISESSLWLLCGEWPGKNEKTSVGKLLRQEPRPEMSRVVGGEEVEMHPGSSTGCEGL